MISKHRKEICAARKDFDKWNEIKKSIHTKPDNFGMHEREIWWITYGMGFTDDYKWRRLAFLRKVFNWR